MTRVDGDINLSGTGFARVRGKLHAETNSKEVYTFNAQKGSRYSFHASNLHPGENLQLKLKNEKGDIIASAQDSYGDDDPHLFHSFKSSGKFKLIISIQSDKNNKGKIPFNLSVTNYDHNSSDKLTSGIKQVDTNASVITNTSKTYEGQSNLTSAWEEAKDKGIITLTELDDFLAQTTEDGSSVSSGEISTLNLIYNSLDEYVNNTSLLDYYKYIFGAAIGIGDNPANKYFTGGVKTRSERISLGNLEEGFTGEQVKMLRDKWFKGMDLPLAHMDGDSARNIAPSSFNYGEASGELFNGSPSYLQLAQGGAGTCYFLSSLNAVANASSTKDKIQDMFIDNNDGTFGVRFYEPSDGSNHSGLEATAGKSAWVTVNRQVPIIGNTKAMKMTGEKTGPWAYQVGDLYYYGKNSETNLLWASLAEKALAQVNETDLLKRSNPENSYAAIEGGYGRGLDYITGLQDLDSIFNASRPFSDYAYPLIDPSEDPLLLLSFSTWSGTSGEKNFVSGHAYSVIGYDEFSDSYQVSNPWGQIAQGYEPVFDVPASVMESLYSGEKINSIDYGQIALVSL